MNLFYAFLLLCFEVASTSDLASHPYFDLDHVAEYYGSEAKDDMRLDADRERWLRPVIDTLREDDHDDFELADIMALAYGEVDSQIDFVTEEQQAYTVDLHNLYRTNTTRPIPVASDMKFVEYNTTLQYYAYDYLKKCVWGHGWGDNDVLRDAQGQNLYYGPSRLVSRSLYLWYIEHSTYYWENRTCWLPDTKYICGHLTQMLWHNSTSLGGAFRSYCFPQQRIVLFNVHYLPKGNYISFGFQVFKYGWHCTRCDPGMLCFNNQCIWKSQCQSHNLDCRCNLACTNCGQPDWKECRCICKPGWHWEDCSYPCSNEAERFMKKFKCRFTSRTRCSLPAYSEQYEDRYLFFMACQQFCGLCATTKDKGVDQTDLCCGGKICEPYYALNEKTCECELLCPSYKCIFPPPTTTSTSTTTTTTSTTTTTTSTSTTTTSSSTAPTSTSTAPTSTSTAPTSTSTTVKTTVTPTMKLKNDEPLLNRSSSFSSTSFYWFFAMIVKVIISLELSLVLVK